MNSPHMRWWTFAFVGRRSMNVVILRLSDVKARTGLSRSTIYARIAQCSFPVPVSLGGKAVGWIESEVNDWLAKRIEESRERRANR